MLFQLKLEINKKNKLKKENLHGKTGHCSLLALEFID